MIAIRYWPGYTGGYEWLALANVPAAQDALLLARVAIFGGIIGVLHPIAIVVAIISMIVSVVIIVLLNTENVRVYFKRQ